MAYGTKESYGPQGVAYGSRHAGLDVHFTGPTPVAQAVNTQTGGGIAVRSARQVAENSVW